MTMTKGIWIALAMAIVYAAIMIPLMLQKTNAIAAQNDEVTITGEGYVIAAPDIEGQVYFTQPDGTVTITLE